MTSGDHRFYGTMAIVAAVVPIHDLITRRRIHPAYVVGLALSVMAFPPVIQAVSALPAWHRLAASVMQ